MSTASTCGLGRSLLRGRQRNKPLARRPTLATRICNAVVWVNGVILLQMVIGVWRLRLTQRERVCLRLSKADMDELEGGVGFGMWECKLDMIASPHAVHSR